VGKECEGAGTANTRQNLWLMEIMNLLPIVSATARHKPFTVMELRDHEHWEGIEKSRDS
jgi:hypothetical protein